MKNISLIALLSAISLTGCGSDEAGDTDNACNYIVGNTYYSVEVRNCGAGLPPCQWRITFSVDGSYDWRHDDQAGVGNYTCNGLNVEASGMTVGRYDPSTSILKWNGVDYQPQ